MKTYFRASPDTLTSGSHSFGVCDNRGRDIGAIFEVTETESLYMVRCQATRAAKAFGPWQSWQGFASESERALYVVKYLQDAKKRAVKTAGV